MCDEQATFITQVRILDLQQKFFQSGRLGSTEKKIGLQQKFFESGRWVALKILWPPTKVLSKWEMGSTVKKLASNKSSFKVGDG
jgi:hypothetical protein